MLSDYEATQVMFFISCHDQDSPVVKHLYELHKMRDEATYDRLQERWVFHEDLTEALWEMSYA